MSHASVQGAVHQLEDVVDVRPQRPRGKAKLFTADQARALERFLAKPPKRGQSTATLRARYGAGVILLGAYASKRRSCIHRLGPGSLRLTRDAVCAESYKQKNKSTKASNVSLVFGAPRRGLTCGSSNEPFDWGAVFMSARLAYAEAIGWDIDAADFLIPTVRPDGSVTFASNGECTTFFKRSLIAAGIDDPHLNWGSLRPLLNTTAAQTWICRDDRALLGNWSPNSDSVDCYDRGLGAHELMVREECLDFHRAGGQLGGQFELPQAGSGPPCARKRPASSSRPKAPKRR